jgi:hypothetical protein
LQFIDREAHHRSTLTRRSRPRTTNNNTRAEPNITTNTYVPHNSLDTISLKIKKLQSDLSSAATGQCWGPGKQKVLDCEHDVDALAAMVKKLDIEGATYVVIVLPVPAFTSDRRLILLLQAQKVS